MKDDWPEMFGKSRPFYVAKDIDEVLPLPSGSHTYVDCCLEPQEAPMEEVKYYTQGTVWAPIQPVGFGSKTTSVSALPFQDLPQGVRKDERIGQTIAVSKVSVRFQMRTKLQYSTGIVAPEPKVGYLVDRASTGGGAFTQYAVSSMFNSRILCVIDRQSQSGTANTFSRITDDSDLGGTQVFLDPSYSQRYDVLYDRMYSTPVLCIERCNIDPVTQPVAFAECPDRFSFNMTKNLDFCFRDPLIVTFFQPDSPDQVDNTFVFNVAWTSQQFPIVDQAEYCIYTRVFFTDQ